MGNKAIWLFGLSGAGKTTISLSLSQYFISKSINHVLLDGDIIRKGLNKNLGFSDKDRRENIRRLAEVCNLILKVNAIPVVAAITPFQKDRALAETIIGKENLLWVYVKCSIEECEKRDPKGLYKQAREGKIIKFTGISDGFDIPKKGIFTLNTNENPVESCANQIIEKLNY